MIKEAASYSNFSQNPDVLPSDEMVMVPLSFYHFFLGL
jgi:hypothetical protein